MLQPGRQGQFEDIVNGVKEGGEPVRNVDYTEYEEGIYVGYRWFDKENLPVSYPFGYGLSYTSFEWGNAALKAFAKTRELQPGESQTIKLTVNNSDLASYDQASNAWVVEAGEYSFFLGASSRDIRATLKTYFQMRLFLRIMK